MKQLITKCDLDYGGFCMGFWRGKCSLGFLQTLSNKPPLCCGVLPGTFKASLETEEP